MSVSMWRELQRLNQILGLDDIIEKARKKADESNWHEYINMTDGVFLKRKDQSINIDYVASFGS